MGVAGGTRFYHTQNSNHLDQSINLNKHKRSLLVNYNTAKCNVSQDQANCREIIHDGAMCIKAV